VNIVPLIVGFLIVLGKGSNKMETINVIPFTLNYRLRKTACLHLATQMCLRGDSKTSADKQHQFTTGLTSQAHLVLFFLPNESVSQQLVRSYS
jgi:hypothetical protein